jgi:hypothetical protein
MKAGLAWLGLSLAHLAALLVLQGCASAEFTKEGASEEQFVRDEQLCRSQVRRMLATERDIDDSRRDVFRSDAARTGQTTLPDIMANSGDSRRSNRLMENCMTARGWSPKSPWWQRLGS